MSWECTAAFLFSLQGQWNVGHILTHFSVTSWYVGEPAVTEISEKFRLTLLVIPLVMENLWEAA